MKINSGGENPPNVFGTEEQAGIEQAKQEKVSKAPSQVQQTQSSSGSSSAASAAKKGELAMTGLFQAAALRSKVDEEGYRFPILEPGKKDERVRDLQIKLNEYREQKGLPPLEEDGIYGEKT